MSTRDEGSAESADERYLVSRLKAGEAAALEELVARYHRPLVLHASRLLDDLDVAQDIAQEVFIRLWQGRRGLRPETVRAYVYRLAHNLAVDELRKRSVRARPLPIHRETPAPPATPADVVAEKDLDEVVTRAIARLPPRRREVFVLSYFHQLSYQEIGSVMRISPETVKIHMAHALADLRASLGPIWQQLRGRE